MAAENKTDISEEQVRQSLENLGVFVGDLDGTTYVKCNTLQRAMFGGENSNDHLVTLTEFTNRLNGKGEGYPEGADGS